MQNNKSNTRHSLLTRKLWNGINWEDSYRASRMAVSVCARNHEEEQT